MNDIEPGAVVYPSAKQAERREGAGVFTGRRTADGRLVVVVDPGYGRPHDEVWDAEAAVVEG